MRQQCCWRPRPPVPLDSILDEIEKALSVGLYYLAIMLAVTLPDICVALESQDARSNTPRYKAWYDAHLSAKFPGLTADDCFSLRCGVVHQGRFGLLGSQYERVIFTLPDERHNMWIDCVYNNAYIFSADAFCREVISAVQDWFATKQSDPIVEANLPR
jgi:hypothetical protein